MTIDQNNSKHIITTSGMTFQRLSDKMLCGTEIYLGYTYYIGGKKLDIPKLETKEDFIEIENKKEKES